MYLKALISVAFIAFTAATAEARPVSYAGGWTLIEETNRQTSTGLIHYTPDFRYSVGARVEWDRKSDILFTGVQGTWLAKRWFGEDYQANLYLWGAAGAAQGIDGNPADARLGGQAGIIADWETRRLFLSYHASARDFGEIDASVAHAMRAGFAPYEGDTGDLHTWLMVEIDNRPDNTEPVGITPVVRFLYGSALFEAGWSLNDDQPLLNFQYRF
jgi:hypothetical protein